MRIRQFLSAIYRNEHGATAVEYGLIVALIVLAMIFALQEFANSAIGMWTHIETNVANAR